LPPIPPAEGAPPGDRPGGPGDGDPGPGHPGPDDGGPGAPGPDDGGRGQDRPGGGPAGGGPWDDRPAPRDEDAPPDDGLDDLAGQDGLSWDPAEEDDDPAGTGPAPQWPALGVIPPALRAAARQPAGRKPAADGPADGRPVPGLLDVTLPWVTWAGTGNRPGTLGRIGPITPVQARQLARAAETDPAAHWRIIVTSTAGQAIAVTRIRRRTTNHRKNTNHGNNTDHRTRSGPAPPYRTGPPGNGPPGTGPPAGTGLVGRITLTISEDTLAQYGMPTTGQPVPGGIEGAGPPPSPAAAAALRAAARALDRARAREESDRAAGGCAHGDESGAYRPPPRLREFVIARDVTCRNPACRQPAWRADLDHTIAYDRSGRTCRCNLGGACRRDHQLKQHPRWKLEQTQPGEFTWTTPAGRKYTTTPDTHPV
ncbi:MAG TPA: HNH endonuclease signature motif containing protein, partial [Streptosporangiaceae bacterium]|nr:HNH endonuclease signature motif containing protein [Streptosporangiaceae bacterium]